MSFKQGGRNKNSIVFFCCNKQEENYMQENKNEQTTGTKTPKLGQESSFQAYRLYNCLPSPLSLISTTCFKALSRVQVI